MPSEAKHTPPRADCPSPGLWKAPDAMASEVEVGHFLWGLIRLLKPRVVVETGCYVGHTTKAMASALEANGYGMLHTCDIAPGCIRSTRNRCRDLVNHLTLHECAGLELAAWLYAAVPRLPVDLAFLDSTPESRGSEWLAFSPRYAVLHDTGTHRPSVRAEVSALPAPLIHFDTPRGVTLIGPPYAKSQA